MESPTEDEECLDFESTIRKIKSEIPDDYKIRYKENHDAAIQQTATDELDDQLALNDHVVATQLPVGIKRAADNASTSFPDTLHDQENGQLPSESLSTSEDESCSHDPCATSTVIDESQPIAVKLEDTSTASSIESDNTDVDYHDNEASSARDCDNELQDFIEGSPFEESLDGARQQSKDSVNDAKQFTCPDCQRKFSTKRLMKLHSKIHATEKPHDCPNCQKAFVTLYQLKLHLRTHLEERPFECPHCAKTFNQKTNLRSHLITHKEKQFKCAVCGKDFKHSSTLKRHTRIHTGERPYECPTCQKTFQTSSTLTVHRLSHVTDKPNKCAICDKGFVTPYKLKLHTKIHTRDNYDVFCPVCKKGLSSSHHLKRHIQTHNKD